MSSDARFPARTRWTVVLLAVAALAAIAAERWGWAGRLRTAGEPERLFVWIPDDLRDAWPRAFFLSRDFDLAERPASASLTILGDPEYVLHVGGHRVGSGRFRPGAPMDRYEVGDLLAAGRNRIVVEMRSRTAAGGLTLRLEDGAGRTIVATGPDWEIHREYYRGLFGGKRIGGQPVRVLGRAPLGRWGRLVPGPARLRFEDALAGDRVVPAERWRDLRGGDWSRLTRRTEKRPNLGPAVEFDFGAPVAGYLQLAVRGPGGASGLLDLDDAPAADRLVRSDAVVTLVAHRGLWQDAVARRFRYVRVWGLEGVTGASVLPLSETGYARLAPPAEPPPGLLGVTPPPSRAPVEDVVRRELERSPGLAVGKDL